jgi:hypothetical protein
MIRVFTRAAVIGAITVLALASSASAQTVSYLHQGRALFDLTFPDGWQVEFLAPSRPEGARTISGGPKDRFAWIGFWTVPDAKGLDDARDQLQRIAESVVSDARQVGKSESSTLNGMPVRTFKGTGRFVPKDKKKPARPVEFQAMLFEPSAGTYCIGVYLGPPDTLTSIRPALEGIVNSMKPSAR